MFGLLVVGVLSSLAITVLWCRRGLRTRHRQRTVLALRQFRQQREHLEAKFADLARHHGRPHGIRWSQCEWENDVLFAVDRSSRMLTAMVGISVQLQSEDCDDDNDESRSLRRIRCASAIFHHRDGRWGTSGRALFNLAPAEAVTRYESQFEPVTVGS